jgi:dGTP triphosphohydrolase
MLYEHFCSNPELIPREYSVRDEPVSRRVVDYLSGMTDGFALRLSEKINPGISGNIFKPL